MGVHVQGKPEDPRTSPGHAGEDRPLGEHQSFRGPLPGCYLSARHAGCCDMKPLPSTLQGLREPPGQGPWGRAPPYPGQGGVEGGQIPPTPAGLFSSGSRRNKWSQKFNPGFYIFLYFKNVLLSSI